MVVDKTRSSIAYGVETLSRLGLTNDQIMGVIGSAMGESGRTLDPNAVNPHSGATGIFQHLGPRKDELVAFASNKKYNGGLRDYRAHWDFVAKELGSTEKRALEAMKRTKSRAEASAVWTTHFERPGKAERFLDKRAQNAEFAQKLAYGVGGGEGAAGGADILAQVTGQNGNGGNDGQGGFISAGDGNDSVSGGMGPIASLLGINVQESQGPMTPGQGLAMALGGLVGGPSGIKLAGQLFGTGENSEPHILTGGEAIGMGLGGLLGGIPGAMLGKSIANMFGGGNNDYAGGDNLSGGGNGGGGFLGNLLGSLFGGGNGLGGGGGSDGPTGYGKPGMDTEVEDSITR